MKLKNLLLGLCIALTTGVIWAQASIDMKPGLWEMRFTKMERDGMDLLTPMQTSMALMTPEQRKRIGDPTVTRICVSQAMSKSDWLASLAAQKRANCAPPKVNRDGNRMTFETTCKDGDSTIEGKGEIINAGDQATTKGKMVTTDGSGKHTTVQESQMKFLGSDCGNVKPLDELASKKQNGKATPKKQPGK
ncbi:MAG: DUF3617 domain-containing protein [Proteobacteria bacterium]|nr:DUF3617 domain-containing protein [Pseudomonadota bacterium]